MLKRLGELLLASFEHTMGKMERALKVRIKLLWPLLRPPKEKASLKVGMMELELKVRVKLEFVSEFVELWPLLRLPKEKASLKVGMMELGLKVRVKLEFVSEFVEQQFVGW